MMKSKAPSWIPSIPDSMEPWPVSIITSTPGLFPLISFKVARPSKPGIFKSRMMMSKSDSSKASTALCPLLTVVTSYPLLDISLAILSAKATSSSTINTLAFFIFWVPSRDPARRIDPGLPLNFFENPLPVQREGRG